MISVTLYILSFNRDTLSDKVQAPACSLPHAEFKKKEKVIGEVLFTERKHVFDVQKARGNKGKLTPQKVHLCLISRTLLHYLDETRK